ncbi:hypothetical protein FQN54_002561 [Arachnomyces sp. PD_36]|nr:hypothetical protein FQN54_002561 [Arachnomyces sp. PD_36]
MAPTTRHSTRQATEKVNEAAKTTGSKKAAPAKRKGSTDQGQRKKQETKDEPKAQQKAENGEEAPKPANGHRGNGDVTEPKSEKDGANGDTEGATDVKSREQAEPSNILEKGIIYFFVRARVGVEEPESMDDVARSFIVLRPLPEGAALKEGSLKDDDNCRLLAMPKKSLPKSNRDRFMGFVEKAGADVKTLRDSFLTSEEYETKTKGTREKPAAIPIAEGVYAFIRTSNSSHLAYLLTKPTKFSQVHEDFGLKNRGSFVVSSKNPKYPGPPSSRLPQGPEYPEDIQMSFQDLRWVPLEPKFIEYPNAQILIIGERQGEFGSAVEPAKEDEKTDKEAPKEEIEQLEHENEVRADQLGGDHAIFNDLSLNAEKYPKVFTTWV